MLVEARDNEDRLSEDELVSLTMTLFLGGFETTAAQLGSTVWTLMAHRNLWQELLDDLEVMPAAIEELWRWIPSFRHGSPMIRWANEDVELSGGVIIPKGDPLLPEHQVANRDEAVFAHAWELDFHRVNPQTHLSLAWGSHRCMGAHLANLEVELTLKAYSNGSRRSSSRCPRGHPSGPRRRSCAAAPNCRSPGRRPGVAGKAWRRPIATPARTQNYRRQPSAIPNKGHFHTGETTPRR